MMTKRKVVMNFLFWFIAVMSTEAFGFSVTEKIPSLTETEKYQSISYNKDPKTAIPMEKDMNVILKVNDMGNPQNAPEKITQNDFASLGSNTIMMGKVLSAHQNAKTDSEIFECGSEENLHKGNFTLYDYGILCGMLVISLGIGVFYGFFQKSGSSSNEFLLGSEMSLFPVTLSLTTSFITAIELLGNPSEMFYQGTQFALIVIPMVFVIPIAVKIFYPIYFKLELTSCYEYLGIRFGKEIRILGAVLYIIQMCFYTAVAVLAPAIALSKATGLNTRLAVVLIYLVCIFYSSQGGMKAVVIADTFQACVLAVSLILIIVLGHFYTGDLWKVFETSGEHNRLELLNFDPNPTTRHTVFSVVLGGFFYWTSLFCTNQASVQKCMSLKSLKSAKIALGFAILGLIVVFMINFYTGLMVFTHYVDCDPLSAGHIGASDQLLPYYIMDVYKNLYSVAGIFVAGIFAASLGTVASALNSLSAVTCEDLLINGFNMKIHPDKGALYAKWMSLGYGIFSFVLVFIVERLGGVLQATLTLNGLVGGVTLGLFVLGIAFKRANTKGAFYGGIISLILVIYIGVMAQITNVEPEKLPLSLEKCDCFVNTTTLAGGDVTSTIELSPTLSSSSSSFMEQNILKVIDGIALSRTTDLRDADIMENINKVDNDQGFSFSSIYRVSYMWYSMIGTLLTIILGLIISVIYDSIMERGIIKITARSSPSDTVIVVPTIPVSQLEKNLKCQLVADQSKGKNEKLGFDNLALKIDDEK